MSISYPLSQLDHRISQLREHIHQLSRSAELLSGEEHRQKTIEIGEWSTELDKMIAERRTLSHDAT